MKKLVVVILIILLCLAMCSCNTKNVSNQFSVRCDISDVEYYLEQKLNTNPTTLDWCRYYEIDYEEVFIILTQFRETNKHEFQYWVSIVDADLDEYYQTRSIDNKRSAMFQPSQASLEVIEKGDGYEVQRLTYDISEELDGQVSKESKYMYLVCKTDGTITRIVNNSWAYDSDMYLAYDYHQDSDGRTEEVCVFQGQFDELVKPSKPTEKNSQSYEQKYSYVYNQDGSLSEFIVYYDDEVGEKTEFTYNQEGMRDTAIKYNSDNGNYSKVIYTRDSKGLVTHLHSEEYRANKEQKGKDIEFSYIDNEIVLEYL